MDNGAVIYVFETQDGIAQWTRLRYPALSIGALDQADRDPRDRASLRVHPNEGSWGRRVVVRKDGRSDPDAPERGGESPCRESFNVNRSISVRHDNGTHWARPSASPSPDRCDNNRHRCTDYPVPGFDNLRLGRIARNSRGLRQQPA